MVDDFNLEGKELYKNEMMRVHKSTSGYEEHDVVIGENYIFFDRGMMKDWATSSPEEIRIKYFNLKRVDYSLENPSVSIEEFGWGLAKARIRELTDM